MSMNKYKKSFKCTILAIITGFSISCKAQHTYPMSSNPLQLPPNSYMNDAGNELDKFVGTWHASNNGKFYILKISKIINKKIDYLNLFQDTLLIKYTVKNNTQNSILQSTENMQLVNASDFFSVYSYGLENSGSKALFYYSGTHCGVGWGVIELSDISNNQINWSYVPNSTTLTDQSCPAGQDLIIYLPITQNLVFTKQ